VARGAGVLGEILADFPSLTAADARAAIAFANLSVPLWRM